MSLDPKAIALKFAGLLEEFNMEAWAVAMDKDIPMELMPSTLSIIYLELQITAARLEALIAASVGDVNAAMELCTIAKEMARGQVINEMKAALGAAAEEPKVDPDKLN